MNDKLIELLCAILQEKAHPSVGKSHSFAVGRSYLIRTVTMMYTGRIEAITESDLWLKDAAWIADSGRYHTALSEGTLNEVEPYPDYVIVTRQSIVDSAPWRHELPRTQK